MSEKGEAAGTGDEYPKLAATTGKESETARTIYNRKKKPRTDVETMEERRGSRSVRSRKSVEKELQQ